jgi:hypothetical protein
MKFKQLWSNFPEKENIKTRCYNKQPASSAPFSDYCAIMLSEALIVSGFSMNGFKGKKCWSHDGMRHALLAEELANHLKSTHTPWLGKMEKLLPSTFEKSIAGRSGIIFFKDYWKRRSETFENRSGDHIDLWNGSRITSSSVFTREILEFFGRVSDLNQSREIWFWEIS